MTTSLFLCAIFATTSVQAGEVLVVRSTASPKAALLYSKAILGFENAFGRAPDVITAEGEWAEEDKLLTEVRRRGPRVVVAIGLQAAKMMRGLKGIPVVTSMVPLSTLKKLKGPNTTGVTMEPAPAKQLEAFRQVLPRVQRIGLIFSPKLSDDFVGEVRQAAQGLGIQLVEQPVSEHAEVITALKKLLGAADCLWLIRDALVVTPEFFSELLLVQAEKKFPVLVFSEQFVRMGAICAYASSYELQGAQVARLVQSILAGTSPGDIPIQAPEGKLAINIRAASLAGVEVSAKLLSQPNVEQVDK